MKKQIFTLLLSTQALLLTAQNNNQGPDELRTLTKLDLGLEGIGVSVEPKLSRNTTLNISLGGGGFYEIQNDDFHYEWNFFDPALYVSVSPKFYYNRTKRFKKGKATRLNSGNYFALKLKYTSGSIANEAGWPTLLLNAHWGMQRPIGKKWVLNTIFGAGFGTATDDFTVEDGMFYPVLDIKFSYIFSKMKNAKGN